jgi:hypothetical protein
MERKGKMPIKSLTNMSRDAHNLMLSFLPCTIVYNQKTLNEEQKISQKKFVLWTEDFMQHIKSDDPVLSFSRSDYNWVYHLLKIRYKNEITEEFSKCVFKNCFQVIETKLMMKKKKDYSIVEERLMHTLLHICNILDRDNFILKTKTIKNRNFNEHVATVNFVTNYLTIREENIMPAPPKKYSIDRKPEPEQEKYIMERTPESYEKMIDHLTMWLSDMTKDPSSDLLNLMWKHNEYINRVFVTNEGDFFNTTSSSLIKNCYRECEDLLGNYDSMISASDLRKHSLISMLMSISGNSRKNRFVSRYLGKRRLTTMALDDEIENEKQLLGRKKLYLSMIDRQCESLRNDCVDMHLCKEPESLQPRRLFT